MQRKRSYRIKLICLLIVQTAFLVWCEPGSALTDEQIFLWVASEVGVDPSGPAPEILYVDLETLKQRFNANNRRAFPILAARYGMTQARSIMSDYLNGLAGLFDPATKRVYVGDFLNVCRRQAILAHELTHYCQFCLNAESFNRNLPEQMQQLARELQAQHVEKKFMRTFCSKQAAGPCCR